MHTTIHNHLYGPLKLDGLSLLFQSVIVSKSYEATDSLLSTDHSEGRVV